MSYHVLSETGKHEFTTAQAALNYYLTLREFDEEVALVVPSNKDLLFNILCSDGESHYGVSESEINNISESKYINKFLMKKMKGF